MAELDLRKQDKRTAERAIRQGVLDEKAWEKHLKSLPDLADRAVPVATVYELMDEDDVDPDDESAPSNEATEAPEGTSATPE